MQTIYKTSIIVLKVKAQSLLIMFGTWRGKKSYVNKSSVIEISTPYIDGSNKCNQFLVKGHTFCLDLSSLTWYWTQDHKSWLFAIICINISLKCGGYHHSWLIKHHFIFSFVAWRRRLHFFLLHRDILYEYFIYKFIIYILYSYVFIFFILYICL